MDDMFLQPKKRPVTLSTPTAFDAPVSMSTTTILPEPSFVPPDVVAEQEEKQERASETKQAPTPPKKAPWWRRMSKKKKILLGVSMGVLIVSGITAAILLRKDPPAPVVVAPPVIEEKIEEPPKPTTIASTLTGVQVDPEMNKRGVTAVMIENSLNARPQSGLLEAGIVYEAIAEGGITRFLALYQEGQPDYIGPVRSARPYFVEWLAPYNATYAHAGGSPEALQLIKTLSVRDMDHGANGSSYTRVSSRFAPHNLYTSTANLDAIRNKKAWGNPEFKSFVRKADAPQKTLNATKVNLNVSGPNFAVSYDYDAATNSYRRILAGKPHTDERSGKQLTPKVVVALVIQYGIHRDGVHSAYQTVGSGQAFLFQDGVYQEAYWSKSSQTAPLELKDAGGRTLELNAGQTWITVVGQSAMVTYSGPSAGVTP